MTTPRPLNLGWIVALAGISALAVMAVLPPVIGGDFGAVLHRAFAVVCHQIPERTPHVAGGPIALCHRCSGILAGLLAGVALAPVAGRALLRRVVRSRQGLALALAALPMATDWALGASGLWANVSVSRVLTGAVFGLAAGVVLGANVLVSPPSPQPTLSNA